LGFSLLRLGRGFGFGYPFGSARLAPGQISRVKTDRLRMALDHDSGQMEGKCLTGRFAERPLSSLSDGDAMELLAELHQEGAPEAAVMEAYLDWRLPDWREQRSTAGGGQTGRRRSNGPKRMSAEEAYAVLGLGPNAREQISRRIAG
jgi:hypothetical protein